MSTEQIQIGSKLSESIACAGCTQTISVADAHCFKGKKGEDLYYCSACKQKIDLAFTAETENPNLKGALILGIIAGIISGAVWCIVEIKANVRVGYIALGAGYLIGNAVVWGSGKKRGGSLQLISGLIALFSIVGASYFSIVYTFNKYATEELDKAGKALSGFLWLSPFDSDVLSAMISPITLFIWGIGIYIAFRVPQARKL